MHWSQTRLVALSEGGGSRFPSPSMMATVTSGAGRPAEVKRSEASEPSAWKWSSGTIVETIMGASDWPKSWAITGPIRSMASSWRGAVASASGPPSFVVRAASSSPSATIRRYVFSSVGRRTSRSGIGPRSCWCSSQTTSDGSAVSRRCGTPSASVQATSERVFAAAESSARVPQAVMRPYCRMPMRSASTS